ncbi:hypothetical protein C4J81_12770 [Deltaproteobacteria bacterium Smac51]|nr:hypothetical protein C4J81_12770 [Deltaproteobacteria bacterium Smac51]
MDTDKIFQTALKTEVKESLDTQTNIAKKAGISVAYLNDLIHGRRFGTEDVRRRLAVVFGWPHYEAFLNIGRQELGMPLVKEAPAEESDPHYMNTVELSDRGFFAVPFSDNMRLAAGPGGTIEVTDEAEVSHIVVHGPSLGRHNAKKLQAFRVGGDSMEPVIAKNGIVMADLKHNDARHIHEGSIYVLCWDRDEGECAVKYLRWAEKGKLLSVESENSFYKPVFKSVDEVVLIGKVIWAWRDFD